MEEFLLKNLGLIGAIIFVSAYIPQILHLIKVKDSTGISVLSWSVWFFGALLLLIYAIALNDLVFLTLTSLESLALLVVIILTLRYKKSH